MKYEAMKHQGSKSGSTLDEAEKTAGESESCQSSVASVIYSLRKKIESDSRKRQYQTGNQEKFFCYIIITGPYII